MLIRSRAIVLHTLRYNDEHLIVHLFTEQEGYVAMLVRISRSPKAAVKHTLFQPLALLEVEWNQRAATELQRPKMARPQVVYTDLWYNGAKLAIAFFLSEFLGAALRMEPASAVLFSYLERSVRWLDLSQEHYANFHLVFLLRLTQYLGFLPPVDDYAPGTYYDMQQCCFTYQCPQGAYLEPSEAQYLPLLIRLSYENMRHFRFTGAQRNRFLNIVNDYYRLHLAGFPVLKSLDVLREMFRSDDDKSTRA